MSKRRAATLFALPTCIGMLGAILWLNGGGGLKYVEVSPRFESYRIEFHELSRLERWRHSQMKRPRIIRLYDNNQYDNLLLGESPIVDLQGDEARVTWPTDASHVVRVGKSVVFNNISPEAL